MKWLTLLRHGKSVRDVELATDHERPLAPRGRQDAALVGRTMAGSDLVPDVIVSSPAVRARQTAEIYARNADFAGPARLAEAIYLGDAQDLLEVVRSLPEEAEHALLVGHNPGFEEFAALLLGIPASAAGVRMPTAAAAHLELPIETWSETQAGSALLLWLLIPRLLK